MNLDPRYEVNAALESELSDLVLTPQSGIQRIRKVLFRFRFDMPMILDLDQDGNELSYTLTTLDNEVTAYSIYIIYGKDEEGYYEFYSEMVDNERLEAILSDEEDTEDE